MSENETTVAVNLTSSTNEKPSGNGSKPARTKIGTDRSPRERVTASSEPRKYCAVAMTTRASY
jgi:hypothetical protein